MLLVEPLIQYNLWYMSKELLINQFKYYIGYDACIMDVIFQYVCAVYIDIIKRDIDIIQNSMYSSSNVILFQANKIHFHLEIQQSLLIYLWKLFNKTILSSKFMNEMNHPDLQIVYESISKYCFSILNKFTNCV